MAVPDTGCGVGGGILMAVADDRCGRERQGSHGCPRRWLWSGEAGVLMAVPDAVCWM